MKDSSNDYVIRVFDSVLRIDAAQWNALLGSGGQANPFMRLEYLAALEASGSAVPATGWTPRFMTAWRGNDLHAACPLYLKDHSWGEYVFDWAWANAHERNDIRYYPKAVVAVPFTPVPGPRLIARDEHARRALIEATLKWCRQQDLSSLHLLFLSDVDAQACERAGLMLRNTVQFHWTNSGWDDFDAFLASLSHDKRKKIRQERRKVADAGITFRWSRGAGIAPADWDFFYGCYERTYYEHGNAPYLTREFFAETARTMPDHWLLFVAERDGKPVATSLIGVDAAAAYGRYWGAVERVDCLHFEACYYQPLQWCIEHGVTRFEGGAQGEHKMARGFLPTRTWSAHWLAHPAFADAVERFLQQESGGIANYLDELNDRNPFRAGASPA